jgi:hypothetical protein
VFRQEAILRVPEGLDGPALKCWENEGKTGPSR